MYILKIQQIFFGVKENMIHDGVSTYLGVANGAVTSTVMTVDRCQ
jgi:hypothetical protein